MEIPIRYLFRLETALRSRGVVDNIGGMDEKWQLSLCKLWIVRSLCPSLD